MALAWLSQDRCQTMGILTSLSRHLGKEGGGGWTAKKKGRTYDNIAGMARGGLPESFCRRRALQMSFRMDTIEHSGPENCYILARAWCHRMQFFFDWELAVGSWKAVWKDEYLDDYIEPLEAQRTFADPPTKVCTKKRIQKLRGFKPQ